MSKLGETADRILELLSEGEKISVQELEKKLSLTDGELLDLLNKGGLIELKKGEVRLTEFGTEIMAVEQSP